MDRNEAQKLPEKYSKKNLPCSQIPTPEECFEAVKNPEEAEEWINDYLDHNPPYKSYIQQVLELAKSL